MRIKVLFTVLTLLGLLSAAQVAAQGKTGTTITLDGTNCSILYSQGAYPNASVFCYLRHNAVPIQIINANEWELTDNGTGFFRSMNNNMGITDGNITLYNWENNYSELFIAIIAPNGYNIARYQMDVNSSVVRKAAAGNAAGAVIEEYTYTENNSGGTRVLTDNVFTLSGSESQMIDVTKTGEVNKLYFRVGFKDMKAYQISFNLLKITFTVDEPFEISIPNESGGTEVHTGLVDLGEFKNNDHGAWTFTDTNVTDVQDFGFFGLDDADSDIPVGTTKVDGEDYVWTVKNGTFYLEAPKTFRVTAAKMKFLSRGVETEASTEYNPVTSVTSGGKYIIGNGTAFLRITGTSNYTVSTTTDKELATVWTVTSNGSGAYYIYSEDYKMYLYANNNLALSTGTTVGFNGTTAAWTYNTTNGYLSMAYRGRTGPANTYYLQFNNNNNIGVTTTGSGKIAHPFTQVVTTNAQTLAAGTYTATVYGTDPDSPVQECQLSPDNPEATVTLGNLNNDAVKFKIDGLTGDEVGVFRVSIDALMLDPFVQTIETAYIEEEGGNPVSTVSSSSENLKFNNGETIVVPIPGTSAGDADKKYQLVFRNAFNENRSINVSDNPCGNGLSNYYIIDSPHEVTGTGSYVDADRAGTVELEFTNIKQVKAGTASRLQDNEFDKTAAQYEEIKLKNEEAKSVYIYSADKPTYVLLPEVRRTEHVAYCYYQAKVMPYVVEEVPDLEMADVSDIIIYESTLKGANNKNKNIGKDSNVDRKHYFYGVKVKAKKADPGNTSEVKGILTSEQIINAVKDLLIVNFNDHLYNDDPFRTILYLDMSELTAVSDADGLWEDFRSKTADNCLYFMPASFSQQAQNVVAGGYDGKGEAVGDIVIYDQQPFFTPYTFKTGTHMVTYERTGTNDKAPTQNTTVVLPFHIPLSADGYLKTYSNQVDEDVRFYHMTEVGEADSEVNATTKVYTFTAQPVTTGTATANTPYHIVAQKPSDNASYKIQLTGATFMPSSKTVAMTDMNGTLTGYGNYNGVAVDKTEDILYFTKDYFWRSSTLTTSNTVKVLPYRAYYTTTQDLSNAAKQFSVVFLDEEEVFVPGIATEIEQYENGNEVRKTILSDGVYDLSGRKLAENAPLKKGIYIMNGKKILVK